MRKLKGLSVSVGGGEESGAPENGADVQNAGLFVLQPKAAGQQRNRTEE